MHNLTFSQRDRKGKAHEQVQNHILGRPGLLDDIERMGTNEANDSAGRGLSS